MIDGQVSRQEVRPNTASTTRVSSPEAAQVKSNLLSDQVRSLIGLELSEVESMLATELKSTKFKTGPGTQGRIEKNQGDRLAFQLIAYFGFLECRCLQQQGIQFRASPILGI